MYKPGERLIVALDVPTHKDVEQACVAIGDNAVFYKVGLQLFLAEGAGVLTYLKGRGLKVFLDLKLHDIPHQIAGACREIARMGVDMTTIHTMGGVEMMWAAAIAIRESALEFGVKPPILLGVTVLTSLNQSQAGEIGIVAKISEHVVRLATLAKESGLDGVVASPLEVEAIRATVGEDFVIVTPGIRSSADVVGDQQRVMSAADAITAGSTYLVVGRPIMKSDDPGRAAGAVVAEIERALNAKT
ncbi:MAG: orotidine 5'-phosphate decarboxylase [Candidatus Aquicultor primus]|uniref:Orotidine 5'-phosphate decarboxylase n=1 Tax=Candidatus Aquicultor primus TaxID=1797195 RepID=A0A1F2USX9_9ACTN|nr:MAG: orotidine 5'-phosphate decarboxylase [Candidatus Aquicultor primus]HCG99225.1 orotidine-5'-phosphate decarboxylase [Actinomycetota bacterium]